jgi:VanZ family protein
LGESGFGHAAKISTSGSGVVLFLVRHLLKYWIPVFGWMLVIFCASGDLMSAEHTSRFIGPFVRWFDPDISDATIASIQFVVRKCAHLAGYAILAALLYRAFRRGRNLFGRAAAFAFLTAALYATLDEFHQSFVPSRTGTPWDVGIDCIGAAIGLALCLTLRRKRPLSAP